MSRAIAKRLAQTVALLWLVSVIAFLALRLTPGDPAVLLLGQGAANRDNAALLQQIRQQMGLDKPVVVQYFIWVGRALRGELGNSSQSGAPVLHAIVTAAPPTIWLILLAMLVAIPIAILLGISAAYSRSRLVDRLIRVASSLAMATPGFWIGLLCIILFSVHLGWLPSSGYVAPQDFGEFVSHLVLPVLTLAVYLVGILTRFVYVEARASRDSEYIRTAVAMGIATRRILWIYTLRNAVLPLITVVGVQVGVLVGGAVLVEQVFGLGGVGQLMLQGVLNRDYPVVQGAVLVATATVVLANMAADILRTVVDPRLR